MKITKKVIHHLNPEQVPVMVADQPLYAIAKQVQWCWPETQREDKFLILMGGLRIAMNLLKLLASGKWLDISTPWSWHCLFWSCRLNDVRITRDLVEICTSVCINFNNGHINNIYYMRRMDIMTFHLKNGVPYIMKNIRSLSSRRQHHSLSSWCCNLCYRSERKLEKMYVQSLLQIAPWLFALDHTNYCRWLSVHISDIIKLSTTHPELYR